MKHSSKTINLPLMALLCSALLPFSGAGALTLKTGEVLGSDGKIYEGASPAEKSAIIARAKRTSKTAGVHGSNVYVVVEDTVTFVPLSKIRGKTNESVEEIIIEAVSDTLVNGRRVRQGTG